MNASPEYYKHIYLSILTSLACPQHYGIHEFVSLVAMILFT